MGLLNGCNHIAIITSDVDRFVRFYGEIFEGAVVADMAEGELRHVLLDLGGVVLHPFEMKDNPYGLGSDAMFARGHIDHFALNVEDEGVFEELRHRLVEAGVTDGTLTDFGVTRNVWFVDPDGMGCEIVMWANGAPLAFDDRVSEAYEPRLASTR